MEAAVWNLEDRLKLSTKQALFLLLFAASSVFGLCMAITVTLLRRLKSRRAPPPPPPPDGGAREWPPPPTCGWAAIKRVLTSSVRWSRPRKWPGETASGGSWRENSPLPLLLEKRREFGHGEVGWQSHNSDSPVWQRPILMGEKCELPRFSGLILYDENGQLLCDAARKENSCKIMTTTTTTQEKTAAVVRKTLRDLL
ncbi:Transmembrane protein [Trema orientale]|uniref:Transmembrane protein n=1 Tax=Trema orientale TaxID=63057 RepID=A0A2P5FL67_TREOI|nr:Transmembrane protein [Trema orientale]